MTEEIGLEKCNFWNFRGPVTLTLNPVIRHTIMHHSSTSMYILNFIKIGQTDISPSNVIRSTRKSRPKKHIPIVTTSVIKSQNVSKFCLIFNSFYLAIGMLFAFRMSPFKQREICETQQLRISSTFYLSNRLTINHRC